MSNIVQNKHASGVPDSDRDSISDDLASSKKLQDMFPDEKDCIAAQSLWKHLIEIFKSTDSEVRLAVLKNEGCFCKFSIKSNGPVSLYEHVDKIRTNPHVVDVRIVMEDHRVELSILFHHDTQVVREEIAKILKDHSTTPSSRLMPVVKFGANPPAASPLNIGQTTWAKSGDFLEKMMRLPKICSLFRVLCDLTDIDMVNRRFILMISEDEKKREITDRTTDPRCVLYKSFSLNILSSVIRQYDKLVHDIVFDPFDERIRIEFQVPDRLVPLRKRKHVYTEETTKDEERETKRGRSID